MTFYDKRGRKFTGRYALHGRVCDPKAGRCMTWDMAGKLEPLVKRPK